MRRTEELRLAVRQLSFRVLGVDPETASTEQALRGVLRFLYRRRALLAEALDISAEKGELVFRATGEAPGAMLDELRDLLMPDWERPPELEIEVDPAEFAVDVAELVEPPSLEREILHSKVRYVPYPICEWFEVTTGDLTLTDRRIRYEPEYAYRSAGGESGLGVEHEIPLGQVLRCYRDSWLSIPCLMVETPGMTYRYSWPARRGAPRTIFDVDEWIGHLRSMAPERD